MLRSNGGLQGRRAAGGFSLFEMVVTICSIVILYMVAEQRLNELPAAAERASFHGVLEQIKTGVNFEMINRLAGGRAHEILQLEGTNPMNFLIETPANYGGELNTVTDAVPRRNAWYFETSSGQLVYVVGGPSLADVVVTVAGVPVNLGQIRLKLTSVYSGDRWEALVLAPVNPYTWARRIEQPVALN